VQITDGSTRYELFGFPRGKKILKKKRTRINSDVRYENHVSLTLQGDIAPNY
jgi:hypothetical protein